MLSRCFFCRGDLPRNDTLERFPSGTRIAYDAWRGRLWAVCPHCARWVLAPFETRWEALEEIERAVRDRGRTLARTDNVTLVRVGPVEVVRVGRVDLREEAWWRYGATIAERARRARSIARTGKWIDGAIAFLVVGVPYWGWSQPAKWIDRARRRAFGRNAWVEPVVCRRCSRSLPNVRFNDRVDIRFMPAGEEFALLRPCRRCGAMDDEAGETVGRAAGRHLLNRLLAYNNFTGGSEAQVETAASAIREAGSAEAFMRRVARDGPRIGRLEPSLALGLEIAAHDVRERVLLATELAQLEAVWRQEERIAAIADGELTP